MKRIGLVDYGVGNLFSLRSSLSAIGVDPVVSGDPAVLAACERIILPGVGAFGDAAEKLRATGLDRFLIEQAAAGKPLMGICLGMQLLFEKGFEYGEHEGLGLIKGEVRPIAEVIPADLKIPHIGWNALSFPKDRPKSKLYRYIDEGDFVYFVHSYYGKDCMESTTATTEYEIPLTASVENGCVYGTQFHPEKSGKTGLAILRGFIEV